MSKDFKNIQSDEIAIDQSGDLQLTDELKDLVSGGVNPEDTEEEINISCKIMNTNCGRAISEN